jgi:ribonucleoside-diphosphate reductase alpha chain
LKSIRCDSPTFGEDGAILSCPDAIAKALEAYLADKTDPDLFTGKKTLIAENNKYTESGAKTSAVESLNTEDDMMNMRCPDCGEKLMFREGCLSCVCGYSKCS